MKYHKGISENFRDVLAQEQVCECLEFLGASYPL